MHATMTQAVHVWFGWVRVTWVTVTLCALFTVHVIT